MVLDLSISTLISWWDKQIPRLLLYLYRHQNLTLNSPYSNFLCTETLFYFYGQKLSASKLYYSEKWLRAFAYQIGLTKPLLAGGILTLAVVLITVSIQTYMATTADPAQILRHE